MPQCYDCGQPAKGFYCKKHRAYHTGMQIRHMRQKRADPAFREAERLAVKERMRRLRARRAS